MLVKICFILLTGTDGSVLLNPSQMEAIRRTPRCEQTSIGRPYEVVFPNKQMGFYCVRETPEEVLDKIQKECK